ncbi:hypothetical protein MNV49_000520 [Pseudohyphozyma bogoriensis]|nr:hypothetical protein MNV49_000520 [Pseudohyphozyma bogoriensis]
MAAPGVSGVHDVKFGQSFLQDDGEHAPLFAFRYSQKPQSLDTTRPGTLSANPANPAALLASFPAVSSGSGSASSESGKGKDKHDHWFTAQQVPSKEVDCILVWDDEAQTFVLERLDSTVKLSHDRAPRASLQHHSLPASPNLHSSTNSQPRASQDSQLDADGSTDSSDGEIRVPSVPPKHLRKIASDRARQALHAVDEPRGRPRSDEDSSDDSSDDDDDEDEEDSGPEGYLAVPGTGGKMPLKAPPPRPMSGGKMPIKAPPARIEQSSDDDDDDDDDESESESEMEALASNINATMVDSGGRRRSITGASGRGRVASKGLAAAQPQRPQVGRKGPAPAAVAGRIAQKGLARKEPVLKPEDDVPESSEED